MTSPFVMGRATTVDGEHEFKWGPPLTTVLPEVGELPLCVAGAGKKHHGDILMNPRRASSGGRKHSSRRNLGEIGLDTALRYNGLQHRTFMTDEELRKLPQDAAFSSRARRFRAAGNGFTAEYADPDALLKGDGTVVKILASEAPFRASARGDELFGSNWCAAARIRRRAGV